MKKLLSKDTDLRSSWNRNCQRCLAGLPPKQNRTLHDIKCYSCLSGKLIKHNPRDYHKEDLSST